MLKLAVESIYSLASELEWVTHLVVLRDALLDRGCKLLREDEIRARMAMLVSLFLLAEKSERNAINEIEYYWSPKTNGTLSLDSYLALLKSADEHVKNGESIPQVENPVAKFGSTRIHLNSDSQTIRYEYNCHLKKLYQLIINNDKAGEWMMPSACFSWSLSLVSVLLVLPTKNGTV